MNCKFFALFLVLMSSQSLAMQLASDSEEYHKATLEFDLWIAPSHGALADLLGYVAIKAGTYGGLKNTKAMLLSHAKSGSNALAFSCSDTTARLEVFKSLDSFEENALASLVLVLLDSTKCSSNELAKIDRVGAKYAFK